METTKAALTLRMTPAEVDVASGQRIKTIGYNGGAPGPLIRLREGVPVTVNLDNDTDAPEYVHSNGRSEADRLTLGLQAVRRGSAMPST